jgi:hypothetical protein
MSVRHREVRDDFTGGYNSRDSDTHLKNNESPDMQNIMPGKRGGFYPRSGCERIAPNPVSTEPLEDGSYPPVTSIWEHVAPGGMRNLMAFAGRELRTLTYEGEWRTVLGMLSFNSRLEFVAHPILQKSLFVNGANGYFETDGRFASEVDPYTPSEEELTEIGECYIPAMPKFVTFFANRVWLAGEIGRRGRVYFNVDDISGNSLYNYFTAWSWIGIPTVRGEEVTALVPYKDTLYVFTNTTMRAIDIAEPIVIGDYIAPSFRMSLVSNNTGAISQRTVTLVSDRIIFMGIDGVYMFDGSGSPFKVSQRVEPDILRVDRQFWEQVCGSVWDRKYVVSMVG